MKSSSKQVKEHVTDRHVIKEDSAGHPRNEQSGFNNWSSGSLERFHFIKRNLKDKEAKLAQRQSIYQEGPSQGEKS